MAYTTTSNHGSGSGATFSISTAAGTKGDLMIIGCTNQSSASATISALSDTVGTSYSHTTLFGFNGGTFCVIYGFLGASFASAGNTLTLTWSTGSTSSAEYVEFTGSSVSGATLDGTPPTPTSSTSATSVTTPSITTTGSDDLVLNYIWENSGTVTFTGWTSAQSQGFNGAIGYMADKGAGTYAANATISATSQYVSIVLAFKAASGTKTPELMLAGVGS